MTTLSEVLRGEVIRTSRRVVRKELDTTARAVKTQRKINQAVREQIGSLQRDLKAAAKLIAQLQQANTNAPDAAPPPPGDPIAARRGLRGHRRRLGVTLKEMAALLGTAEQTVLNWENGTTLPSNEKLPAILAVRAMTPAAARTRLGEAGSGRRGPPKKVGQAASKKTPPQPVAQTAARSAPKGKVRSAGPKRARQAKGKPSNPQGAKMPAKASTAKKAPVKSVKKANAPSRKRRRS